MNRLKWTCAVTAICCAVAGNTPFAIMFAVFAALAP